MNLNEHKEELIAEEQKIVDEFVGVLKKDIASLDKRTQILVNDAYKAMHSANPDEYAAKLHAERGRIDTEETIRDLQRGMDELYNSRLLLKGKDDTGTFYECIKVGLHTVQHGNDLHIIKWDMPVCRHFVNLNNTKDFTSVVKDKHGNEYKTKYKLIARNDVKLRFSRVRDVLNLFPGIFDDKELKKLKKKGFFHDDFIDKMIELFNPDEYDPDSAAQIIVDAFLQELLERRSDSEFRNIVFSIQKKQGEIIQVPFEKNIIVQGCAGSGKSMIMLHRLPIVLYDNPQSLNHSNIYIITPSQMYIQMAENMRRELEISDINMGTINEYYDHCLEKYPQFKRGEYGVIEPLKLTDDQENYVYSKDCINDIRECLSKRSSGETVPLNRAFEILKLQSLAENEDEASLSKTLTNRVVSIQAVLNENEKILKTYYKGIRNAYVALRKLEDFLNGRETSIDRSIRKAITQENDAIDELKKEIGKLNPDKNAIAIKHRNDEIEAINKRIEALDHIRTGLPNDTEYFSQLKRISERISTILEPFLTIEEEFEKTQDKYIYESIDQIGNLIGTFYTISWEISRIDDKYKIYVSPLMDIVKETQKKVEGVQKITRQVIDYDYYSRIKDERDGLSMTGENAVKKTYFHIMGKLGVEPNKRGEIKALSCSPYLYLQIMYQYHGAPNALKESLLSIDEAQGVAPQEIKLLSNVNDNRVVFNLFGDYRQHIEKTKGIDNWSEMTEMLEFERYDMDENYRNASQITEYCNRQFNMNMNAINTTGKGVHEMNSLQEFYNEMIIQLTDTKHAGLGAIIVKDDLEVKYLLDIFGSYASKFQDLTGEEFSIHRTRWNIMTVEDAKGLEFNAVIVLSGRMTNNEQYIAFTRALDELLVYTVEIDISKYTNKNNADSEQKKQNDQEGNVEKPDAGSSPKPESNPTNSTSPSPEKTKHKIEGKAPSMTPKRLSESNVVKFFKSRGLNVMDKRSENGILYVIGDKGKMESIIEEAMDLFEISGKYTTVNNKPNRRAWYTKTKK